MTILHLYFYYSNLRPNNIKSFWKKIVYTCDDVETSISNKNNDQSEQFIYYSFLDLRNGTLIKVKIKFWPFSLAYSIKSMIFFKFLYKDDPYFILINRVIWLQTVQNGYQFCNLKSIKVLKFSKNKVLHI